MANREQRGINRSISRGIAPALLEFAQRCREVPGLRLAVVFGSAATGNLTSKSDIDVLVLLDTNTHPETGVEAETIHRIAGDISTTYHLVNPFSFIIYGRNERIEPSLLRNIQRDGFVIYARAKDWLAISKGDLCPFVLVSYTLKGKTPKDKMALQRGLFGYTAVRKVGRKRYLNSSPGLVGTSGRRVGPTSFLIGEPKADAVRDLFQRCNCEFRETLVWLEDVEGLEGRDRIRNRLLGHAQDDKVITIVTR